MAIVIGNNIYSGDNITISKGRVFINGQEINTGDQKTINITVNGDIESIKADACQKITVSGSSGSIQTQSGDVECGNVNGSVTTMSGDVDCGDIGGSVQTMSGNVKHKKTSIGNIGTANFL
jgi:hypothetical protein